MTLNKFVTDSDMFRSWQWVMEGFGDGLNISHQILAFLYLGTLHVKQNAPSQNTLNHNSFKITTFNKPQNRKGFDVCDFFIDTSCSFRIMHQNIAGFLSKKDLLEITLSDLRNDKKNKRCSLFSCSETFIQRNNEASIHLKGLFSGFIFLPAY